MKTFAFILSSCMILLLAFWITNPTPGAAGATDGRAPSHQSAAPAPRTAITRAPLLKISSAQTPLLRAIEADDVCQTARLLATTDLTNFKEQATLLTSIGAPPALQELYSENGPLSAEPNAPLASFHHPLNRLLFALRLTGAYPKPPGAAGDLKRGAELLRQLEIEDPSNAVYPFFLLDAKKRLGASAKQLAPIAARAAHASHFDAYLSDSLREIEGARYASAALFIAVETLLQATDSANLRSPSRALLEIDRAHGSAYAPAVGALLRAGGEAARHGSFRYDFSGREYDAGVDLSGHTFPDAEALSRQKDGLPATFRYPVIGVLEEDSTCDEQAIRDGFQTARALF